MITRAKAISGYLAAGILAVVTLGTFGRLQEYGPQSSLRRWHEALEQGNAGELGQLTIEGWNNAYTRSLANFIYPFIANGRGFEIAAIERRSAGTAVAVEYSAGRGMALPVVWYVEKSGGVWRVNATATATRLSRQLGLN